MPAAAGEAVRVLGNVRRERRALLRSTALQAAGVLVLVLPVPLHSTRAQPAPNVQPTGGVVVAGSASISRSATATTIDQATGRAAVNWQSFDVGARQSVDFHQPSAQATILNRVVGPNPSQIAGRITANGQVILENQDGITFYKGAQVNTAGFLATAAGITNRNFMAGRMVFDKPAAAGARIENQGRITVRDAGIAALVAPQVANSGVITARLGKVVLAGAKTYALDLYGDGLISIDVNGEVTQVPAGPDGKPVTALVTNTGTIIAAGGEVELTAREAAGLVHNLVAAGGAIAAPTVGAETGKIVLNGIGGSLTIAGDLLARGNAPGTKGGQIEIAPDGGVAVAATARIDASGVAGGGVVAVGTTLERARGGAAVTAAMTSQDVAVAPGATIAADATVKGNGGRITILSADETVMDGAISARGGPQGGDGGFAEVSGRTLGFDGEVNLGAPAGAVGALLLDPGTLDIINGGSSTGSLDSSLPTISHGTDGTANSDTVSNGAIDEAGASSDIVLQATTLIDVTAGASINVAHGLAMQSGGDLLINAGITAGNDIVLTAGSIITGSTLALDAPVNSLNGGVLMSAGYGGTIDVEALVSSNSSGGGATANAGVISLQTDALTFGASGSLATPSSGTIDLAPVTQSLAMTVGGSVAATAPGLDVADLPASGVATLVLGAAIDPRTGNLSTTAGSITLAGALIAGGLNGADLELNAVGPITQTAPLVMGSGTLFDDRGSTGAVTLTNPGNQIGQLGTFTSNGDFQLVTDEDLTVAGAITALGIKLQVGSLGAGNTLTLGIGGDVVTPGTLALSSVGGLITLLADGLAAEPGSVINAFGGTVEIAPLTPGTDVSFAEPGGGATGLVIDAADLAALQPDISLLRIGTATGLVSPSAGSISFDEPVNRAGTLGGLELDTTGTIGQAAGATLAVAALSGQGQSLDLGEANAIGTLGPFAADGDLQLTTIGDLAILGAVTASDIRLQVGSLGAGNTLTLGTGGGVVTPGTLSLTGSGLMTLLADGLAAEPGSVISANGGTVEIAPLTPDTDVSFAEPGGVATGLVIDAADLAALQPGISLLRIGTATSLASPSAGSISFDEPVNLAGTVGGLELDTTGTIGQAAGATLAVAALSGQGQTIELTAANAIGTLGSFTAGGAFQFDTTQSLLVVGTILATDGLAMQSGGGLTINAGVIASDDILLTAGDAIAGSTLALNAPVDSTGGGVLMSSGNAGTIDVEALVSSNSSFGYTTDNAGVISLRTDALIFGASGSLALPSYGAIDLAPATPGLAMTVGGSVAATAPGLDVADLPASGVDSLVLGAAIDPRTGNLSTTAGNITLAGALIAGGLNGADLELNAVGPITQTAPLVMGSGTLFDDRGSTGAVTLTNPGNQIGQLGTFTSNGDFQLVTDEDLTVAGAITAIGIKLQVGSLGAGNTLTLGIGGDVVTPGTLALSSVGGLITLLADGLAAEPGSVINAFGGTVEIAPLTPGTDVSFAEPGGGATGLVIDAADLAALQPDISLLRIGTATGLVSPSAGSISFDEPVNRAGTLGGLELDTTGTIGQAAGATLAVAALSGQGQSLDLGEANAIGTLGPFAADGDLQLTTIGDLAILGAVTASDIRLQVGSLGAGNTLTLGTGGGVVTPGTLSLTGSGLMTLLADGLAAEPGSVISANGGTVEIAPLTPDTDVSFAEPGGVATGLVIDAADLAALQPGISLLRIGTATSLASPSAGSISFDEPVNLAGTVGGLELDTTGTIGQAAGATLAVAALSGQGQTIELTAANAIGTLGPFTAGGAFQFDTTQSLLVVGTILATDGLAMQSGGGLTINAGVIASDDILLTAGDAIAGSTLALNAPVDSTGGGVLMSSGNAGTIDVEALVSSNSSFGYTTDNAGVISLRTDALIFGASGSLALPSYGAIDLAPATPGLAMTVGGSVAATAPGLDVADLPASGVDSLVLGAAIDPRTGNLSTTAGNITLAGALIAGGLNGADLELNASGAVTQTAPLVGVGSLSGATDTLTLTDADNAIGNIGTFTTDGDFQVATDEDLTVVTGITAHDILLEVGTPGDGNTLSLGTYFDYGFGGSLDAAPGGRISLVADNLSILPGALISANAGTVEIAPLTPGTEVSFAEPGSITSGLTIGSTILAAIVPGIALLRIGSVTWVPGPTAGSITFDEPVNLTTLASGLELDSTGTISQMSGATLVVGALSGQGATLDLDEANTVGTLGAFAAGSGVALNDTGPLVVAGPVSGSDVALFSVGNMTLAGNIEAPATIDPTVLLQVAADTNGDAVFTQTGSVSIGPSGTLTVALPATGGSASFADLQAPGMQVDLLLGSGRASGAMAVGGLLVVGQGGTATLFGSVAGDDTLRAALISQIIPVPDPAYTFNGCEIATACTPPVTPVTPLTPVTPVTPVTPQPVSLVTGFTSSFGPLTQLLPTWLPPIPHLAAPPLVFLGTPPVPPDELTDPDVVPPNIGAVDY